MCLDNETLDDNVIEEWTVVFRDPIKYHWCQKYLKKGFLHCFAFKRSPGGQFYMVVDPARSHIHIDLLPCNDETFQAPTKNNHYVTIIKSINLDYDRGGFCRFNCVEVVKGLLGISAPWAITPYQLFRRLRNE